MEMEAKKFAKKDDPKAVEYLIKGRDALIKKDYSVAMRNFKKCGKCKITKELTAVLLDQMANCMDELKYFDQQQTFLEELVELDLNYENARQLMNIYQYTNNEIKMKNLNEKIKTLEPKDENERKLSIQLLSWGKDYDEVIELCQRMLVENPEDIEVTKTLINTYVSNENLDEVVELMENLKERGLEDKFLMEAASVLNESYDFEGARDMLLKHYEIHKENEYGINKLAHGFMTNACYHGVLTDDEYIKWMERAV